jgi:sigma-B regulation protein RsbU (phosphoserine phosphatase)
MEATRFERDLQIARQIQDSFLPGELLQPPGWEIAARFQPAREVAGDFYDVFPLIQNRRVGLVIADVCGKGVGAALYMALFRTLIRAFAQQHYSLRWMDALATAPGERRRALPSTGTAALKNAIELTNSYIAGTHSRAHMFASLFFGVLDPANGSLVYVNGGHEPPLIVGPAGVKTPLEPTGPVVGIFPDANFDVQEAHVEPGDILVAVTDGVTEAQDPGRALFTTERLYSLLAQPSPSASALLDRIEASVRDHTAGADQSDDITMLAVRRAPIAGSANV